MREIPGLVEIQSQYGKKNFTVIGATKADREFLTEFAKERQVTYPLLAEAQKDLEAYGVGLVWGTVFFLIDPQGQVVSQDLDEIKQRLSNELG